MPQTRKTVPNWKVEPSLFFSLLSKKSKFGTFSYLLVPIKELSFEAILTYIGQKKDPKSPKGHFLPKRIHQNKF